MSRRKPIVAIDISSTGKGGGPYTSTMNLINSTLKEKYDYRVFTYRTEMGRFISIKRIKDIICQLRDINPDIVHFTGLSLSGFHIAIACALAGIKKNVVVIRGSSTEALDIGIVKRSLIYILEIITLAIASTFYGVSKYSSRIGVAKIFKNKSSGYIYNLPIVSFKSEGNFSKADLGFNESDILMVTVGRVTKDKGYHILSQAIKGCKALSHIKFLIVGQGAYLAKMKEELTDQEYSGQVHFFGYRDDVPNILAACDVFVLPTLHETLSNALLEASSYSLALVASEVGGVPEIITHGVNGFLVPPANPEALTNSIKIIASDETLRIKMGAAAKKTLDIKFTESSIVKRVDEVYKKVLKND